MFLLLVVDYYDKNLILSIVELIFYLAGRKINLNGRNFDQHVPSFLLI